VSAGSTDRVGRVVVGQAEMTLATVLPVGLVHLCPVIDVLPPELTASERDPATKFICNNTEVFSKGEFDLGRSYLIPHCIDTGNHRPLKQPLRRHPRVHQQFTDEHDMALGLVMWCWLRKLTAVCAFVLILDSQTR